MNPQKVFMKKWICQSRYAKKFYRKPDENAILMEKKLIGKENNNVGFMFIGNRRNDAAS